MTSARRRAPTAESCGRGPSVAVAVGLDGPLPCPRSTTPEFASDLHRRMDAPRTGLWSAAPVRRSKRRHTGGLVQRTAVGTLGGAEPIAEHRRSAEVRVKGGRRPSRSDAAGALDAGRSRPDARLSVRGRMER